MGLTELLSTYGQNYLSALLATWGMTVFSFVFVMILAVLVTVMRVSPFKPLRVVGDLYTQVFRNVPTRCPTSRLSLTTAPASS